MEAIATTSESASWLYVCRYLLRLGMGEQELATEMDFSRVGRVNAMLARRLELLAEVQCCRLTGLLELDTVKMTHVHLICS